MQQAFDTGISGVPLSTLMQGLGRCSAAIMSLDAHHWTRHDQVAKCDVRGMPRNRRLVSV